jgi:hypothetical protein
MLHGAPRCNVTREFNVPETVMGRRVNWFEVLILSDHAVMSDGEVQ